MPMPGAGRIRTGADAIRIRVRFFPKGYIRFLSSFTGKKPELARR
jgi:hypothetical protein